MFDFFARFRQRKNRLTNLTFDRLAALLGGMRRSKAGVSVTWETALQASTAYACARVVAEGIAQVPLRLYRSRPGGVGADPATDHPLYRVLYRRPNPWQTSFDWRVGIGLHLMLTGGAFAAIYRNGTSRSGSVQLLPIMPGHIKPKLGSDYSMSYEVRRTGAETIQIPQSEMLHIRGPSWDGVAGLDGVQLAREAIGLAVAMEDHGARFFANGATLGGLLSTDQIIKKEQADDLRKAWAEAQAGVDNAYKTAVLWGGMKWSQMGTTNEASQFIEARNFQVEETCRAFGVLPIMVGHSDKATTYASAEQMFIAHVVYTLGPRYALIEQALDTQLLTEQERDAGFYCKFDPRALMRGSHEARANYYKAALGAGNAPAWMSQDEVRALEELNPMGGDASRLPTQANTGSMS